MSNVTKDNCIILSKCNYSLVQAACQYYKTAVEILESTGFVGSSIHPCLYVKKSMKGIGYVALTKIYWQAILLLLTMLLSVEK